MNVVTPIAGLIASACLPWMMLLLSLFRFESGKLVKRELEHGGWVPDCRRVALIAGVVACAVFLVELYAWKRDACTALRWASAAAVSVMVGWTDYKERVIPNGMVGVGFICAMAIALSEILLMQQPWRAILGDALIGCAASGGVFLVARLITRGGVGFGDVKLFATLGLLLGFRGCLNVMLYALSSVFLYCVAQLLMRKKTMNDEVPLGPFVIVGLIVSVAFGA